MKEVYEASKFKRDIKPLETMLYADGQQVMEGDCVATGSDTGVVVCLIDRSQSPSAFSDEIWEGHKKRAIVKFKTLGFAHYIGEPASELLLTARDSRV
jgi:hypothetical protein